MRSTLLLCFISLLLTACGTDDDTSTPRDTASSSGTDASGGTDTSGGLLDILDTSSGADTSGGGVDTSSSGGEPPMGGLYSAQVSEVVLEVDYQQGAAPYVDGGIGFGKPWDLFIANAGAIFADNPRTLTIPTTLEQMEELTDIGGDQDFTVDEILAIAEQHREETSTPTRRTFYALWVDGYFADADGRRDNVLGVSIGDTEVTVMFKPVIDSLSSPAQVEQVTLIHEFGHAVGMVNRGVPLTSEHHDSEHGAHCSNPDCVMYWTVESSDVTGFITNNLLGGTPVLFGQECLDDFEAAAQ